MEKPKSPWSDSSRPPPVFSKPPKGKKQVFNLYWDPDTNEIVVEHD